MNDEIRFHWRKQMVWGLLFIALGAALLMDQAGMIEFDLDLAQIWRYWPLLLVVIGISRTIGSPTADDFVGGIWMALFGAWLFASLEHLFRLTLWNSWPVLIIITGVAVLLRPFAERRFGRGRPRRDGGPSDRPGR